MASVVLQLPTDSGLLESLGELVVLAGTLVLALMLVGLAAFAYNSLRGDGIRWPEEGDDDAENGEAGLERGDSDDEWEYY